MDKEIQFYNVHQTENIFRFTLLMNTCVKL